MWNRHPKGGFHIRGGSVPLRSDTLKFDMEHYSPAVNNNAYSINSYESLRMGLVGSRIPLCVDATANKGGVDMFWTYQFWQFNVDVM
jgi:hypothetical protein